MQLDKTQGYIFRIKDVDQAKAVVEVLVSQGYINHVWRESTYYDAVEDGISLIVGDDYIKTNTTDSMRKELTWIDTEMFLEYTSVPHVKETIQVEIIDKNSPVFNS